MSYLNSVPTIAAQDLSGDTEQYHAITVGGTIAPTASTALGILQNKAKSGREATAGYSGRSRYRAGGTVAAGNRLTVTTSGWLTAVGSNELGIGTALGAVGSGGIGEGIFNFAGALTEVISGHVA